MAQSAKPAKLRFEPDGNRYIVMLGDERIGFVRRRSPESGATGTYWHATDSAMERSCIFRTRCEAGEWLRKHAAEIEY